jgi:hypothetical protein
MLDNGEVEKPLLEQIMDELFQKISQKREFDEQTILKLKLLAETGDFRKSQSVSSAIKPVSEEPK